MVPRKIEKGHEWKINSNSFEFISNGVNKDYDLEVSKNVRIFGGASIKWIRIVGKVWKSKLEVKKAWGIFASVLVNSKQMEYLI